MTRLEDDIRALLQDRAGAGIDADYPSRGVQVRARVVALRRRRAAAAAAVLVVVVGGALGLTGLVGGGGTTPPAGVPRPPYFAGGQLAEIPGYVGTDIVADLDGPRVIDLQVGDYRRLLLVARCERPGVLRITAEGGYRLDLPCTMRVGTSYQGGLPVSGVLAMTAFGGGSVQSARGRPARLEPGTGGDWQFGVLAGALPDRLGPAGDPPPLLDGPAHPAGGTFPLLAPPSGPNGAVGLFSILIECVDGVRLTFRVPTGVLAVATCEPAQALNGLVYAGVPVQRSTALGLRGGAVVTVTVEVGGAPTDQWRVVKALY